MGVAKAALESSVKYLAWDLGQRNIRVNAISAGPVRTLAARSIAGFPTMEAIVEERSPLRRHVDAEDVGAATTYLLSDDAKNVTGTTLYVDGGYHADGHVDPWGEPVAVGNPWFPTSPLLHGARFRRAAIAAPGAWSRPPPENGRALDSRLVAAVQAARAAARLGVTAAEWVRPRS